MPQNLWEFSKYLGPFHPGMLHSIKRREFIYRIMFSHDDQQHEMPTSYQQRLVIRNRINIGLITPHACARDKAIGSIGNSYELKYTYYTHACISMHIDT